MAKRLPTGLAMNILRVYHQANQEEMQQGLLWYDSMMQLVTQRARAVNRKLGNQHKLTRKAIAGVTSALSPQKAWVTNVRAVEDLLRRGDAGTYKRQVSKAKRILAGEDPADVLVGPKERNFYFSFMGDDDACTIDSHAYNVWLGSFRSTSKTKVGKLGYKLCAADYKKVAKMVGLKPRQLQAVVWLTFRRLHNSRGFVIDQNSGWF